MKFIKKCSTFKTADNNGIIIFVFLFRSRFAFFVFLALNPTQPNDKFFLFLTKEFQFTPTKRLIF